MAKQRKKKGFYMKGNKQNENWMNYNLSFKDKILEAVYKESLIGSQSLILKLFLISNSIACLGSWAFNPLSIPDHYLGYGLLFNILNILVILCIALSLIYSRKCKRIQFFIFFMQFYLCLGMVESTKRNQSLWKGSNYVFVSIYLEFIQLIPLWGKCGWKYVLMNSFILSVYLNVRFTDFEDNVKMHGFPTFVYLSNCIFMTMWSYLMERFDRILFYKSKEYERSLQHYEYLIQEILPVSLLISSEGKIIFYNKELKKLLKIEKEEDLILELNKIKVEEKVNCDVASNINYDMGNEYISPFAENLQEILSSRNKITSISSKKGLKSYRGLLVDPFSQFGSEKKFLDIKLESLIWQGKESRIIMLSEDLNWQRIMSLKRQDQYKDKLFASVSHDLRTPLNGVIGILETSLEDIKEQTMRKNFQVALRSAQLLSFMINDFLDFTQMKDGKLRLSPSLISITQTLKDVRKLIKFQAEKKGIQLLFEEQLLIPGRTLIRSDHNRIKQVVLNLLGNALKFTKEGFIKLSVKDLTKQNSKYLEEVLISVEDTGCGIKSEDLPHLFKYYGRLDNYDNRTLNKNGIGLGLAISQSLVKELNRNKQGKEIHVHSVYNKGTTFSFELLSKENEGNITLISASSNLYLDMDEGSRHDLSSYKTKDRSLLAERELKMHRRALLVDDDELNLLVLGNFLKSFKTYTFDVARDGTEAIELISKRAEQLIYYDVIFMDNYMPLLNGLEAAEKINKMIHDEKIPAVPIISASGDSIDLDKEICKKAGIVDFVFKPYSKTLIKAVLDKHVENVFIEFI